MLYTLSHLIIMSGTLINGRQEEIIHKLQKQQQQQKSKVKRKVNNFHRSVSKWHQQRCLN